MQISDLASAEKSVKKRTQFFPSVKWARVLVNLFSMDRPVALSTNAHWEKSLISLLLYPHTNERSRNVICYSLSCFRQISYHYNGIIYARSAVLRQATTYRGPGTFGQIICLMIGEMSLR